MASERSSWEEVICYRVCIEVIRSQMDHVSIDHTRSPSRTAFSADVVVGDCGSTTTKVSTTLMGFTGCDSLLAGKFGLSLRLY